MSAETHKSPLQLQLEELVRVGVGGKYRDKDNQVKIIQKELDHEEAMLRGGLERFTNTNNDAKAKNQESTTLYHQIALKLICQCLPSTAFDKGVFLDNKPRIWDTCSLIILKNIIDGISDEITINKLSIQIATGLMQEARITQFKEQNKDSYNKTARKLSGKNIPQGIRRYQYKSKVWTYMMNRNGLVFDDWTNVQKLHLGVKMISYCEKLGLVKHQNRKHRKDKTITYVEATPKIIEEIKNFNIKNELLFPKYLPMIAPPRDWTSPFTGGYYGKKFNKENKPEEIANALQLHQTNK